MSNTRSDVVREIRGRLFEAAWRKDSREWLDPKTTGAILDEVEVAPEPESPPVKGDEQRRCWTVQGPDNPGQCILYNGHDGECLMNLDHALWNAHEEGRRHAQAVLGGRLNELDHTPSEEPSAILHRNCWCPRRLVLAGLVVWLVTAVVMGAVLMTRAVQ